MNTAAFPRRKLAVGLGESRSVKCYSTLKSTHSRLLWDINIKCGFLSLPRWFLRTELCLPCLCFLARIPRKHGLKKREHTHIFHGFSLSGHTDVHQHRRVHSRCVSVCITKPAMSSGPVTFTVTERTACTQPQGWRAPSLLPVAPPQNSSLFLSFLPLLSSKSQPGKLPLPDLPTTFLVFHTCSHRHVTQTLIQR